MSVTKFRDPTAMEPSHLRRGDPDLGRRIAALWSRAARFAHTEPRPGVRRFRSIEEANRDREDYVAERMRRLRRARRNEQD